MKILQLGKFYPIGGGVEKVMYDLMTGISEKGVNCDMMCAATDRKGMTVKINEHANLICTPTWTKKAATMISPAMIWKLRRVCRNYDIIHVHHPDPMACLALLCSGYKGKVILHWHSDIQKQKMLLKLYKPLQDWLIKRADCIIGTTPVYLEESPFLRGVQEKTVCLPIGVEPVRRDYDREEIIRNRYEGKKIVFSLGRLVHYKGFRYLVEAAKYLGDEYVVLIGGTGALKDELSEQIKSEGLAGKVELLGRVSDEDLPGYYGACSVFCLSSVQKTEAFGIVQIEAMSCGKPVVATKIPQSGVAWVNADGESGINVMPEDAKGLAEAIMKITSDKGVYAGYSEKAGRRFVEFFTKERMIEKCLKIYGYE